MNVILSIKPEYVSEIIAGRKRFEFRKAVFAKSVEKVYIYASAPISKVVGEFDPIDSLSTMASMSGVTWISYVRERMIRILRYLSFRIQNCSIGQ